MSDRNSAYSAEYYGSPQADNPFGIEALRPTENRELHSWLQAGGKLSDYLNTRAQVQPQRIAAE